MFEELLEKTARVLDKNKIPYMVIGGQALLRYGAPRLTEDVDITLGVDCEKSPELINAVREIHLIPVKEATDTFIRKTNVLPCVDEKTGIRVDFIFSFLSYEREAIRRGKKVLIGNCRVNFASAEDLIIHKIFAGRPRDLEDVKSILDKQNKKLDLSYIRKHLREFSKMEGYKDILEKFQKILYGGFKE